MSYQFLLFGLYGLMGAVLYIFIWSKSWSDLVSFESFRHLVVGFLSGLFYHMLVTGYSFPDSVIAVVVGYFGPDFIEGIMERLKILASRQR